VVSTIIYRVNRYDQMEAKVATPQAAATPLTLEPDEQLDRAG
jgi:hypothetical protein